MDQNLTNNIVNKLSTRNTDMKQRRVINAASAIDVGDYVTKGDLDAAIAALKFPTTAGFVVSQSDETANRALDTVYRNAFKTAIIVCVTVSLAAVNNIHQVAAYTDGQTVPTTAVGDIYLATTGTVTTNVPITFIVLPSNYYWIKKITGTSGLQSWIEWS